MNRWARGVKESRIPEKALFGESWQPIRGNERTRISWCQGLRGQRSCLRLGLGKYIRKLLSDDSVSEKIIKQWFCFILLNR